MPTSYPPEFRERAVELARQREKPVALIAKDLGISETCLRRWMDRADVDDGVKPGLGSDTLIWPRHDGLIWPHLRHAGVVVTV